MTRTTALTRRLTQLTTRRQEDAVTRLIAETARELGIDPTDLRAEAEALTRQCAAVGAHTREARLALVAQEIGVSVEELEAELATMPQGWA